ncbi:hypothetical protein P6B95_03500 [Streptomyces atratus]|uniref:hypothetical protein n=1 Tax=Streptomyces atratus TaxID=1893 RepID=UPI001670E045|nr:hypothetical protein [Streptomyces atratus]WPW26591.1 hypothetical protein P6B95_03500 [Streptomyces atratus]
MSITGGGQGGWPRALEHARMLCRWREGRLLGVSLESRSAYIHERPGTVRRWLREQTALAMAIMHTGRD